jgi:hypothetical protein
MEHDEFIRHLPGTLRMIMSRPPSWACLASSIERSAETAFGTYMKALRFDQLRLSVVNLLAAGRSRWDQGLTAVEMKRCTG